METVDLLWKFRHFSISRVYTALARANFSPSWECLFQHFTSRWRLFYTVQTIRPRQDIIALPKTLSPSRGREGMRAQWSCHCHHEDKIINIRSQFEDTKKRITAGMLVLPYGRLNLYRDGHWAIVINRAHFLETSSGFYLRCRSSNNNCSICDSDPTIFVRFKMFVSKLF